MLGRLEKKQVVWISFKGFVGWDYKQLITAFSVYTIFCLQQFNKVCYKMGSKNRIRKSKKQTRVTLEGIKEGGLREKSTKLDKS